LREYYPDEPAVQALDASENSKGKLAVESSSSK